MKINKSDINKIIELEFIEFKPQDEKTIITSFDTKKGVKARFEIDGAINAVATVNSKTIKMMKTLVSNQDDVEINVDKKFIIKSKLGTYKGELLESNPHSSIVFKKVSSFDMDNKTIENALLFVSKNSIRPLLTGINISETGVVATDSFRLYLNGTQGDKNVTIDSEIFNLVRNKKITEINVSDNLVEIETDGINYYGRVLDGNYPTVQPLIARFNNLHELNLDFNKIKEFINLAVISGSDKTIISIENIENKLVIKNNENYEIDTDIKVNNECQINLNTEATKMLLKFDFDTIKYSKQAVIFETKDDEKILLLQVKKG